MSLEESLFGREIWIRPVLEKPDPRPEVDRVAFEGLISSGRDRARRMDWGTGAIVFLLLSIDCFLVIVSN